MTVPSTDEDEYTVRPYRPSDLPAVVSLREIVLGGDHEEGEFLWKAKEPPDDVPGRTIVAEYEGAVVGVCGIVGLPFRVDGRSVMAAQFVDSLVHPDHRRRGIMVRVLLDLYERSSDWASLHYAFPMPTATSILRDSDSISDILRDLGVDARISPFPEYYRVQRPSELRPRGPTPVVRALEKVGRPAVRTLRQVRSSTADRPDEVEVIRHEAVPVADLAELHRRTAPEAPHLERDSDIYRWRFSNPQWEYVAHTAVAGGETVAAIVAGSISFGPELVMTRLTEVLPLDAGRVDDAVFANLLSEVLADHRESAVVVAGGTSVPRPLLDGFGFLPGDSRWLSTALNSPIFYQTSHAYLPMRSPEGAERSLDDWLLTYFGPEIG